MVFISGGVGSAYSSQIAREECVIREKHTVKTSYVKSSDKINFFLKKLYEENLIDGETYTIAKKLLKDSNAYEKNASAEWSGKEVI